MKEDLMDKSSATTTTQYWGYRELSADELLAVGGGDGGDADAGDRSDGTDCDFADGGSTGDGQVVLPSGESDSSADYNMWGMG